MNYYKWLNSFHLAPLLQVLAILYLTYLAVFKRTKGLGVFFILFGISALVAILGYSMLGKQNQSSYATMWYYCDVSDIILCLIGLVFSWM
jgi:hypothetical protein